MWIHGLLSLIPASSSRTRYFPDSLSFPATAQPAEPAPATSRSMDRQHQVFIWRSGPHYIGLRRICLGGTGIAVQHLGARSDDHHMRARLDPIVARLFFG